jgi:hypothetical protein
LKQHDPGQPYCGVVLFASRALEPKELAPYQTLLDAGSIRCFYLDEMPEVADAPVGLAILSLIRQAEGRSPAAARELVALDEMTISDMFLEWLERKPRMIDLSGDIGDLPAERIRLFPT